MNFIFDTNAYRNLVRGLSIEAVVQLSQTLKNAERTAGYSSTASTVVTMELIKHLQDTDPFKEECFHALCLQFLHTSEVDPVTKDRTGNFLPPMNIILARYFFDDNSKYFDLFKKVNSLFIELAKDQDISVLENFKDEIRIIGEQILFEKEEYRQNVEDLLASMNNGAVDWQYFARNKDERKEFYKRYHKGDFIRLLGIALMLRAHQVMDKNDIDEDAEEKLENFINQFKAAIIMNHLLLDKIGAGVEKLKDVNDHRWNTLNDVQIMFAMLFKDTGILVTEEGAIKQSASDAGVGDRVMTLADYKAAIGI